jgi:hypothetical protein
MPLKVIICIYCKQRKPSSKEHAVQRSLGGDLTLPDVCVACNGGFSPIDRALAESSLVSLMRVGLTPATAFEVKLGGDQFYLDSASGLTFELATRNELRSELYPQVHFLLADSGNHSLALSVKDRVAFERLADYVDGKLASGELRSIHQKIGPPEAGATPRLVMHRTDDGFIRGQSAEDLALFVSVLEQQWQRFSASYRDSFDGPSPPQATEVKSPTVQHILRINVNDVYRAIAKIAFNVMAAKLGPDLALQPEFDPVRDYIRGLDVRIPTVQPGQLAVDDRFVISAAPKTEPPIPCDDHAVVIFGDDYGLVAWVTLYKSNNFIVRLSSVTPLDLIPLAHIFSATRTGNRPLDLEEIVKRLRQRVLPTS